MDFVLFGKVSDFVNGGVGFADFLPIIVVVECAGGDLFFELHEVLVKIIVHHEDVVVLFFVGVQFLLVIPLVTPESVHHQLLRYADLF